MQIVAELASSNGGLSLARLSERLGLPKTSLFSLLRSLEAGGYVISENGHHRLGQEAFNLAAAIRRNDGFPGNVRQELQRLQQACGETTMLGVPARDGTHFVYADVIEATTWLRFSANVGAQRPLYSTAIGLILFAYASPEQQKKYLAATELTPVTPTTLVTRKALLEAAKSIRAAGFVSSSGSVDGATGIAAPVFGENGQVVAAVGFAGLTPRMERHAAEFSILVIDTGKRMSRILGSPG